MRLPVGGENVLRGALLLVRADGVAPGLGACRFIVADDGGVNVRQPGRADDTEVEGLPARLKVICRDAGAETEFVGLLKLESGGVLCVIVDRGAAFIPGRVPCTFAAVLVRDGVKKRCELGGTFRIEKGFTARFVGL